MKYSPERREAILRKLLPPNNRPVAEVAEEEGISDATLGINRDGDKPGQIYFWPSIGARFLLLRCLK